MNFVLMSIFLLIALKHMFKYIIFCLTDLIKEHSPCPSVLLDQQNPRALA